MISYARMDFSIIGKRIEGYLCEDTLLQGDGSNYEYCAAISEEERKRAVYSLMAHILPLGIFRLKDETTLVYQGGFEQWKREWVERIQTKAAKVNTENVMNFCGELYQLETELQNPLDTDAQFYLCNDDYQTFAEKSAELMRMVEHLTEGDELYIGGIIDFHFCATSGKKIFHHWTIYFTDMWKMTSSTAIQTTSLKPTSMRCLTK